MEENTDANVGIIVLESGVVAVDSWYLVSGADLLTMQHSHGDRETCNSFPTDT